MLEMASDPILSGKDEPSRTDMPSRGLQSAETAGLRAQRGQKHPPHQQWAPQIPDAHLHHTICGGMMQRQDAACM